LTGYIQYYKKNGGADTKAMGQTEPYFLPMSDRKKSFRQLCVIFTKKQHGARPCVEKMQLIFFVPPNEVLEGTLHPQKFGCTPKNEGTFCKRVHVPPDEKTCGHADIYSSLAILTYPIGAYNNIGV
jgi:hypothetical protein